MLKKILHSADFCVIGGGIAGICAALAAARGGAKTVLMHDRPTLGGNASTEVRMWICGARGENNRETGIIEEILLESLYKNPDKSHYLFDCVLFEKICAEPNITLLLNTSCLDAETDGNKIKSITGWQLTTQTFHTVEAKLFSDCSGDSILAPLTGADFRFGREAASEFGEEFGIEIADRKTMGISCLIQAKREDKKSEYIPPAFAKKIPPEVIGRRMPKLNKTSENFWYLEYGGEMDCIADAEVIRDELLAIATGVWDYIKNSGKIEGAEYWKLDFLGFLPAKRESRRMVGKLLVTQNDIMAGGRFGDTVAFGGWGLDDHDPGGFYHNGAANADYKTPSPYGIPYRALYSVNIENLFFAGRNISMTHAAMSSTRVMATCGVVGEAVGTAAAIAVRDGLTPHGVYENRLGELQEMLMYNDCFLPGFRRNPDAKALAASLAAKGVTGEIENLRNGIDRNNHTYGDAEQGCFVRAGEKIVYSMERNIRINEVRITFDSDLNRLTLPGDKNERNHVTRANTLPDSPTTHLPKTLVREYEVGLILDGGKEEVIRHEENNRKRTVIIPVNREARGVYLRPVSRWLSDDETIHIFSFEFN